MIDDQIYERTIENKQVQVPEKHAGQEACVIAGGQALAYPQVQHDGTVEIDRMDGLDVQVVIPGDDTMEDHG